jgi:trehalose utilization protein
MPARPSDQVRVLVWGENRHEQIEPHVAAIYPDGMHNTIATGISENLGDRARVTTTTLDEPEHGLTEDVLNDLDVLVWWGHAAHGEVADDVVERVHRHVLSGLGLVVLHSGHWSKIFGKLMGTTCTLRWRSEQDRELVWTVDATHPITDGVPNPIIIDAQEMYGETFDIPAPDELIFISSFSGGEVFRSGLHVPPGPRQDLLLLTGRPGLPGLLPSRRPPGDRQRRRLGEERPAGPRAADPVALRHRRLFQRPQLQRAD